MRWATVPASDWQNRAACRDADPELFAYDPQTDPRANAEAAKAICAGCPVTDDCLSFALATFRRREDRTGIYGGLAPAERRQLEHVDRRHRDGSDPEWASRTLAKANEIGVTAAARFYNVDRRTLQRAWQRHGLGPPDRPEGRPSKVLTDPELAARAFKLAREQRKIRAAVEAFGADYSTLKAAWQRHGLGHPLEGFSREQLRAERNRSHPWRREEQLRLAQARAARRERNTPPAFPGGQPAGAPAPGDPTRRERPRAGRDEERER
jgi:WhiB family redox-sensing transcriptional regulator